MKKLLLGAALALAPLWGPAKTVVVLQRRRLGPTRMPWQGSGSVARCLQRHPPGRQGRCGRRGRRPGPWAAWRPYPDSARLVVAMVADAKLKPAHANVRISMLPQATSLFAKMKALQPSLSSIAAFGVENSYDGYLRELGEAAKAGGVNLEIHKVNKVADLIAALRAIQGQDQALWIAPDPGVLNTRRETFKLMNQFCLANKIGLYAPAASLAKTGALAGVAPNFKEIGRAAGPRSRAGPAPARFPREKAKSW